MRLWQCGCKRCSLMPANRRVKTKLKMVERFLAHPEQLEIAMNDVLKEWRRRGGYALRHIQLRGDGGIALRALALQGRLRIITLGTGVRDQTYDVKVVPKSREQAVQLMLQHGR